MKYVLGLLCCVQTIAPCMPLCRSVIRVWCERFASSRATARPVVSADSVIGRLEKYTSALHILFSDPCHVEPAIHSVC